MANVHFTPALKRFVPNLKMVEVDGTTVAEILRGVDREFPGLVNYLIEDNGSLRKHVNIFINNTFIHDRTTLTDPVRSEDAVHIIQALSGG